jgi:pantoate--beta-alanine ligase
MNIKVLNTIKELRAYTRELQIQGHKTGFVPTMGYLHEGHLSLVDLAARRSDKVLVSIFVNPTQFNDPKDLEAYPVDLERDISLLEERGVSAVFIPTKEMIYGKRHQSAVSVSSLTALWEGADRPGHFEGVTTIVSILFHLVKPACAVFGEKDFQQLRVIEQMVEDLHFDLEIIRGPLVRESDGLAMSSRNVRLSESERQKALEISRGLRRALATYQNGEKEAGKLLGVVRAGLENLVDVKIAYLAIVSEDTLKPVEFVEDEATRMLAAAQVGKIRLIDNIALTS